MDKLLSVISKMGLKSYICLVIFTGLFLVSTNIKAQIGIKGGISISNINYVDQGPVPNLSLEIDLRPYLGYDIHWIQLGDQNPLLSPYLSVYYKIGITKRLDFLPEISYSQKGVDFSNHEYQSIIYKVKINYIEIPLSLYYTYILKEKFNASLYLGGYGAFNLKAVKKTAVNNDNVTTTKLDPVKSFDAGIQFGLNFKYKVGENYVVLDVRFSKGLTNLFTIPEDQIKLYHSIQNSRNNASIIAIAYEF